MCELGLLVSVCVTENSVCTTISGSILLQLIVDVIWNVKFVPTMTVIHGSTSGFISSSGVAVHDDVLVTLTRN